MDQDHQFTGFSQSIYELIVQRAPLDVVLDAINSVMENQFPGSLVSVMMYEPADNTLNLVAGNSLSETYRQAMQGITVEPEKGACGTAASTLKLAVCDDIASDPRWDGFKELAAAEGVAACWSAPLVDSSGNLLGTFATYYRDSRKPSDDELRLIRRAAGLSVLAITHLREVDLRKSTQGRLRLLERGIESSSNGVVMADARDPEMPLVYANKAFLNMTGYALDEIMGRNCRFLQGDGTDPQVIRKLHSALGDLKRTEATLLNYRKDGTPFSRMCSCPVRKGPSTPLMKSGRWV